MTRCVLVTGGSRGIGRAISREFHRVGCAVAVNYVADVGAADELVRELGGRAMSACADVTDEQAVRSMIQDIQETLGPIDVLVNNAGIWAGGKLEDLPLEEFRRVVDVSLLGVRNCTRAVLEGMKERESGAIVNLSSSVALMGWPGDTAYSSAKSAVIGFTRSLAHEVAPRGITANVVVPGLIETDMTASIPERERRKLLDRTLLKRPGRSDEVASLIRFVALEGSYITGSVLVADGGLALGGGR